MSIRTLSTFTLLVVGLAAATWAGPTLAELQKRFEQRYPAILKLKTAGVVGETHLGYLEIVSNGTAEAQRLVNEENADRRQLYELIARDEATTPELVAARNAARNFRKARPGEFLKGPDGQWRQKPAQDR